MYAFQYILNNLLESIKTFNTAQCNLCAPIVLLESINLILTYYAGIFDRGLDPAMNDCIYN